MLSRFNQLLEIMQILVDPIRKSAVFEIFRQGTFSSYEPRMRISFLWRFKLGETVGVV